MNAPAFQRRLALLCGLVFVQRAARVLLRAFWVGMALFLLYWGAAQLLKTKPQEWVVWLMVFLIGLWAVFAMVYPLPGRRAVAWRLDRHLGLREQVSTAWQVGQRGEDSSLARLLVEDAFALLAPATRRVALRGWQIERDLVSTAIVVVLFFLVSQYTAYQPGRLVLAQAQAVLPALGQDARASDVFPSGLPGQEQGQGGQDNRQSSLNRQQLDQAGQALSKMGEQLTQSAATYELGQALQQQDLQSASKSLEQLSGQLESLSQKTQQNTADAMQQAAKDLAGTQVQPLAEHLQQAADNLRQGQTEGATKAFDQLSLDMQSISEGLSQQSVGENGSGQAGQGGSGASISGSSAQTGESQPFTRLEGGEGQALILPPGSTGGALVQAPPGSLGGGASISSPSGASQSQQANFFDIFLTPYHYPWNWRDVVSKYFSR